MSEQLYVARPCSTEGCSCEPAFARDFKPVTVDYEAAARWSHEEGHEIAPQEIRSIINTALGLTEGDTQ